jgi:hypothetical protein
MVAVQNTELGTTTIWAKISLLIIVACSNFGCNNTAHTPSQRPAPTLLAQHLQHSLPLSIADRHTYVIVIVTLPNETQTFPFAHTRAGAPTCSSSSSSSAKYIYHSAGTRSYALFSLQEQQQKNSTNLRILLQLPPPHHGRQHRHPSFFLASL